jgi:hypothetical protein
MGHEGELGRGHLARAQVEAPVHLTGVGRHDLTIELLGDGDADVGLAGTIGSHDGDGPGGH